MSDRDRELIGRLVDAERCAPPQPSEASARAGWSRLQRALPAMVVIPQIDVPPAGIETAVVGKAAGIGKLVGVGHGIGWVGKTIVGAVVATTVGTVGVVATQQDARRDAPVPVVTRREPATSEPIAAAVPVVAILPATPPAIPTTLEPPPSSEAIDTAPSSGDARPRAKDRSRSASDVPTTAPAPVRPSALDSESASISAAHRALGSGDARGALALLDAHAARYPSGSMSEDREALRVVALCRAGRTHDANRVRAAFLKRWPDSMHVTRVRAACSDASVEN